MSRLVRARQIQPYATSKLAGALYPLRWEHEECPLDQPPPSQTTLLHHPPPLPSTPHPRSRPHTIRAQRFQYGPLCHVCTTRAVHQLAAPVPIALLHEPIVPVAHSIKGELSLRRQRPAWPPASGPDVPYRSNVTAPASKCLACSSLQPPPLPKKKKKKSHRTDESAKIATFPSQWRDGNQGYPLYLFTCEANVAVSLCSPQLADDGRVAMHALMAISRYTAYGLSLSLLPGLGSICGAPDFRAYCSLSRNVNLAYEAQHARRKLGRA
ncbi:hypothetical protein K431DRAFT_157190 [Polychaeton citri CBS 116435]|uniref:Uncharacterized protein n=1 Tax=Polychaeton citri CBS 116435 TaxID=1314669 RepID=A0A9P4QEH2_9PEZI|nr:hypothetical protein K431DRAFT_157190 [Polychaeton citri CBS 116435]